MSRKNTRNSNQVRASLHEITIRCFLTMLPFTFNRLFTFSLITLVCSTRSIATPVPNHHLARSTLITNTNQHQSPLLSSYSSSLSSSPSSSPLSPSSTSPATCPSTCHCDQSLTALRCQVQPNSYQSIIDFFASLPANHRIRSLQLHNLTLTDSTLVRLPSSIHHLNVHNCSNPIVCQFWLNSTRWPNQLITLELPNNRLDAMPSLNISSLKQLDLSSNLLRSLDLTHFRWCSALRQLNLSHNQISSAAVNRPFSALLQLQYLNLAHNRIDSLRPLQLHTLSTLIELDLSNNRLASDEQPPAEPLLRLHSIALNQVGLIEFPDWLLSRQLLRLTFVANRMQRVARSSLERHPLLIELDLSQNKIETVSDDAFIENVHLLHLDLSNNRLRTIDQIAWPRSLQFLRLASNSIRQVSFNTFESLTNLQVLDLSENKLFTLEYHLSDSINHRLAPVLPALTTLDVSDNVALRSLSLPPAANLRHLKLNRLPRLQTDLVSQIARYRLLEALQVAASPLLARDLLQHFDKWPESRRLKYFNLGSNQITTLDQHVLQRRLSPATLIDLHDNPFDCDMSLQWLAQEVHMQQQQPALSRQLPQMLQMHEMRCDRPTQLHNHSITDLIAIAAVKSDEPLALMQAHQSLESAQKLTDLKLAKLHSHHRDEARSPGYYPLIAYLVVFNAVLVLAALVPCSLVLFLGLAVCGEQTGTDGGNAWHGSSSLNRLRRLMGHEMLTSERVSFSSRNDQVAIISSEHFDQADANGSTTNNNVPAYH